MWTLVAELAAERWLGKPETIVIGEYHDRTAAKDLLTGLLSSGTDWIHTPDGAVRVEQITRFRIVEPPPPAPPGEAHP